MRERRQDPRDDAQYSLRNLLRTRAEREGYELAVLSTDEGMLMAGTQEDRTARRAAAHAADELAAAGRFDWEGRSTGARMSALRFESRGHALCLTVIGSRKPETSVLEGIASRVRAILIENHLRQVA